MKTAHTFEGTAVIAHFIKAPAQLWITSEMRRTEQEGWTLDTDQYRHSDTSAGLGVGEGENIDLLLSCHVFRKLEMQFINDGIQVQYSFPS